MFLIYQFIISIIILISPIILLVRIFKNKEDKKRFVEKFCYFSKKRGNGKLIWFHGSSVGEILSIIPLIKNLEKNNSIQKILITSSTLSSSFVLKKFKLRKTVHQFFPIDLIFFTKIFLNYWRPSIAIFIESEIWPSMFLELNKKSIPLLLMNARITNKTYKKWSKINLFSENIFNKINIAYPQNKETHNYLKKLKVNNIKSIGNLKFTENKKNIENFFNKKLIERFNNRKIWCASSTHPNEEFDCAQVHIKLKKKYNNLLTIIIPRHIHRANEIKSKIQNLKLNIVNHSSNIKKLNNVDIYLVDTYGETEKFYKISKTVFLGGSLIKHGGQNPIEAARLGSTIISGPNIDNFKEVYQLFYDKKIAYKAKNINELAKLVDKSFKNSINNKKYSKINKMGTKILTIASNEINNLLKNEIKKT